MDWEDVAMVFSVEFWRMALLWTLSLLYSYLLLVLKGSSSSSCPSPRQFSAGNTEAAKPICVITGATSGLGAAAAKALSAKGYRIALAGRSPHLLAKIVEEIMREVNDAQLKEFIVDLSSIQSIVKFKHALEQWLLDSKLMMATNFMGAFVLTNLLLPLLENSHLPSRIINVTSFTHRCVQVNKGDLVKHLYYAPASRRFPLARIYELSKLYLLLFTYELHRKLCTIGSTRKVSIMAADPGAVKTNIMRELPPCLSRLAFAVLGHLRLLQTPDEGVSSIIDAALAPPEASGLYFFGGKGRTIESSALSYDGKLAEELWFGASKLFREAQAAHGGVGVTGGAAAVVAPGGFYE